MEGQPIRKRVKKEKAPKARDAKRPETVREMQSKRVGNMNRDMKKFALVDLLREADQITFRLVDMKEDKTMNVRFKERKDVTCSCMDWRIRGRNKGFNCKHILYIATQILALGTDTFAKNAIHDYAAFEHSLARIRIAFGEDKAAAFKVHEEREITADDLCPVCFTEFIHDTKENMINCTRCRGLVHRDCMVCWLRNAVNKSCVYCHDRDIAKIL